MKNFKYFLSCFFIVFFIVTPVFSKMSNPPATVTLNSTTRTAVPAPAGITGCIYVAMIASDGSEYVSFYIADDESGTNERIFHGPVAGLRICIDSSNNIIWAKSISGTPTFTVEFDVR